MKMIKIIVYKNSKAIKILAPIFKKELVKLNYDVDIIFSEDLNTVPNSPGDIFFVFTPHKFKNFVRNKNNKSALFIMYQQEQLSYGDTTGIQRIDELKSFIDKYDYIVDISDFNKPIYKSFGRNVDYVLPTAYHENFEFKDFNKYQEKYNCLFFGRYLDKPRRQDVLRPLIERYNFYPQFEGLYDDSLKIAVMESKIILNIHQSEMLFPEWLRIIIAIANKKLVISEPVSNINPLLDHEHIILTTTENLSMEIDYFLKNEKEYNKIVNNSYDFIKSNYRMDFYIKEFFSKFL